MKSYSSGEGRAFSAVFVKGKDPAVSQPPSNVKAIRLDKNTKDARGSTDLKTSRSPNNRIKFLMTPDNSNGDDEIKHITRKHKLEAVPDDDNDPFRAEDLRESSIKSPFERLMTPLEDYPFGSKDIDREEESHDSFLNEDFSNQIDDECFTRATIRVLEQQEKEIQDKIKKEKQKLARDVKRRKKNTHEHSSGGGKPSSSSNKLHDIINQLKF